MKSIKSFKYVNTNSFDRFLREYGYKLDDVFGFESSWREQYHGNVLKEYAIFFKKGAHEYFKVVCFKSLNEYKQSSLGFNGETLLEWYQDANIAKYKYSDNRYIIAKC